MGEGRAPLDELPVHHRALYEHMRAGSLLKGALAVLFSPVPNRLRCHRPR